MDDLLDLDWADASNVGGSKPLAPGAPVTRPTTSKPATSQFDFLAKSSTGGNGPSGTSSPNYYSTTNTPRSTTPSISALNGKASVAQTAPTKPPAPSASNGNGNDAFSSLLGMGSGPGSSKNMTLAQRQAQMAEEKKRKDEVERQQFAGLGSWEQFGSTSTSISGSSSVSRSGSIPKSNSNQIPTVTLQPTPQKPASSFDALLHPISRPSSSTSRTSPLPQTSVSGRSSGWGDDDFLTASSSKPAPTVRSQVSPQPDDPWDFDQLPVTKPSVAATRTNGSSSRAGGSGMRTPDPNFDFGEWRDEDEEEQGILSRSRSSEEEPRKRRDYEIDDRPKPRQATRATSPPPHVVGQIVEMGFSPLQAHQALAKTSTGLDVQAALDNLLAEAFQSKGNVHGGDDLGEADHDYVERERIRREEEDKERRRRRRQGPSRETVRARAPPNDRDQDRQSTGTPIQADQILAQASEIGQSVFTKATSLWNTGKERALKAYEEQKKVYDAQMADQKKGKTKDGRPRWMVDAEERERGDVRDDRPPPSGSSGGGFRDDDEDDDEPDVPESAHAQRPERLRTNGDRPQPRQRPQEHSLAERYISTKERADLLFADEAPKKYVSPARHRKPTAAESTRPSRSAPTTKPTTPLPARTLVPADPSAIQTSSAHKAKGNDHFKLGRFTEAESAYSAGIRALPDGHLHLVPLHNNRAATRLKLGESTGAAEDCTIVITIIGPSYHPSKEAPLPAEIASEVKLADAVVKAMTKRAQAWEMAEKWVKAVEDWEKVLGFDAHMLGQSASTTRNLAAEGLRRSKRMVEGGTDSKTVSSAAPKRPVQRTATPVAPSKPSNVNKSEAVASLRAASKALEAEDQQRLALKDSVEARLNSWKSGKETNLRALLASLDAVLWDEVLAGGLKVGMHELIVEKQVKIKYMKVIARLHPDKLDVNKTTVEQRMLANGAFGTLNEAWQAFNA